MDNQDLIEKSCELTHFILERVYDGEIDREEDGVTYYTPEAQEIFDKYYDIAMEYFESKL